MGLALVDADAAFATGLVLLAGILLAGAVIQAFAARHRELRADHAAVAAVCGSVAAYLVLQTCLYRSPDLALHAELRRWEQWVMAPFMVAYPAYLAGAAGLSRRLVGGIAAAIAMITALAAWHSSSGLWMARIDHLEPTRLPWGEEAMLARGPASPWLAWSLGTWVAMAIFGIWASLRLRRDPAAVGALPLLLANVLLLIFPIFDSLLDLGAVGGVFISELLSPILTGAMWWRVSTAHRRRVEAWRHLFARAGDAVMVVELERGRVVEANQAAAALIGRSCEEMVGQAFARVLPIAADAAPIPLAAGGEATIERICLRSDGSAFPAEIGLRRAEREGRPCVVASMRDLSRRRQAERELVENERRLRQVIKRCPIPVAEGGIDGRALAVNPSFDRLFGYDATRIGSFADWASAAQPDPAVRGQALARWEQALREARAGEGVVPSFRAVMHDRAGAPRRIDISSVIVGDRLVTFFADHTEILAARDRLAEQEALHRAVIEEAADGVVVSATRPGLAEPAIELWNRRMAEITGIDAADARARGWSALTAAEGGEIPREPARDLGIELLRTDGTRRSCALSSSEAPGEAGGRRLVSFVRDISEQRRAEEERRQLEAQTQRAQQFEALGVLAGGIAHDFNNLLMTILGRAGLVRAAAGAEPALRGDLDEMEAAAKRAATLCQQLLAYAGKGTAQVDVVDLAAVAHAMEPMLALGISKRVAFAPAYGDGALIVGDAGQIRQVILNLVTNAAEAIGDRAGTIALRVARAEDPAQGEVAVLEVADDGQGMDEATRARMFDPFFTSKFTGRGLGLAVVQGIVRAHRGTIAVESEPGTGTTVRVSFPALQAQAPAVAPSPPAAADRGAALVVDDEPAMRAITADMLACLGFSVRQAATAREALDAVAAGRPLVVILDLSLPDAPGEEVLRSLRRIDPRARVIVASGYGRADVQRFLGPAVVDGILTKPYGLEALSSALEAGPAPGAA